MANLDLKGLDDMDVMLDLETWGTKPGSAIRSIAAVTFNFEGALVSPSYFYRNIDDKSCLDAGLKRDERTVAWWATQDAGAQQALLVDQKPLQRLQVVEVCRAFDAEHISFAGVVFSRAPLSSWRSNALSVCSTPCQPPHRAPQSVSTTTWRSAVALHLSP